MQRLEGEAPLVQPGVGHRQGRFLDRGVAIQEQIEVDRPRPEARPVANAAELALDLEEEAQELTWRQLGVDESGGVQEPRLIEEPDRIRFPEARDAAHGGATLVEELERSPDRGLAVTEVRPQADVGARHGVSIVLVAGAFDREAGRAEVPPGPEPPLAAPGFSSFSQPFPVP